MTTTVAEFGDSRRFAVFGDKLSPVPATESATIVASVDRALIGLRLCSRRRVGVSKTLHDKKL